MKILVFGASGSGTTTLAQDFAQAHDYIHLDADDYYWEKTDPPYQFKIPLKERSTKLMADLKEKENVIISGSLSTWGTEWLKVFNLGVFLYLPPEVRIQRLLNREINRYGKRKNWDQKTIKISSDFIEWAKHYDDPTFAGRGITQHKKFINALQCPVLKIEEDVGRNKKVHILSDYLSL